MKKCVSLLIILAMFSVFFACAPGSGSDPHSMTGPAAGATSVPSRYTFNKNYRSFGTHFKNWLSSRGYSFSKGGFGGYRSNTRPNINRNVVVFIHGNASRAHGAGSDYYGWYKTYSYLRNKGWNDSELYAVNYGYSSASMAAYNDHRSSNVNTVKNFIKAVYSYVGSRKLTVIAHSLGVTVTRKAMKDGGLYGKVKTFIAIAGGNHGLPTCGYVAGGYYPFYPITPTCSSSTGFFHAPKGHYKYKSTSNFIGKLLSSRYGDYEMRYKSTRTYVIYSTVDEICGARAYYTSKLAGAYKSRKYTYAPYGHFGVKDRTAYYQYKMVQRSY